MEIKKEKLSAGDLVWAQMKYSPYWPAKVVETPPQLGKTPSNKLCVLFFGTKQFGFVERDKIVSFVDNRTKFVRKGKGVDFRRAVEQMDEYVLDSVKFRSHACVKPINNQIKIKTEHQIETQLGIKVERSSTSRIKQHGKNVTSSVAPPSSSNKAEPPPDEKKRLIDNILSLKLKNQTLVQKLNEMDEEQKAVKEAFDAKVRDLTLKLEQAKMKLANEIEDNEKCASDLKRENQLLTAQNKQLTTGLAQEENADVSGGCYEVESLLDHKEVRETYYLVRWKGFDESDDSWERESNLDCSSMLKKYKKLKKITK